MARNSKTWSDAEKETLCKLFAEGMGDAQIGPIMGRGAGGVAWQRHQMGLLRAPANQRGAHKGASPKYSKAPIAAPPPEAGDCRKHLALIARANGGRGFPYLTLPPAYRVAA